jgi:predicted nicotinamide N-methyase
MAQLVANVESNVATNGCAVTTRLLLWGQHEEVQQEFPEGFDMILAADVIYEEEAGGWASIILC